MDAHDLALAAGGCIGGATAIIHGTLLQRRMVKPLTRLAANDGRTPPSIVRLIMPLLQYSSYSWLLGGIMLVIAALFFDPQAQFGIGMLAGLQFLFATVGNAWATRGRHPGWVLMALACVAVGFGMFR